MTKTISLFIVCWGINDASRVEGRATFVDICYYVTYFNVTGITNSFHEQIKNVVGSATIFVVSNLRFRNKTFQISSPLFDCLTGVNKCHGVVIYRQIEQADVLCSK